MSVWHYGNKTNLRVALEEYNRWFPMQYYFRSMIPKRSRELIRIADLGCGVVCNIGQLCGRYKIRIYASDILQKEYAKLLHKKKITLVTPVKYQDITNLTYRDNNFDIVHCVNTLDHLKDVKKAISEMKRVCKPNGWIYLRHYKDQRSHKGGHHRWDVKLRGFVKGSKKIAMSEFATVEDGNYIVSRWQKTSK